MLDGIRVIECSLLGPAAITSHLVDLGAEVIKVEAPAGDYVRQMTWPMVNDISLMHLHVNRGKQSLVLDLKVPEAIAVFEDLVRESQVVIEAMSAVVSWPAGLANALCIACSSSKVSETTKKCSGSEPSKFVSARPYS